jgi:chemotaxis protein MotB
MNGKWALVSVAALGLAGGCVPQEKYAALRMTMEANEAGRANAEAEAKAQREKAAALEAQLQRMQANSTDGTGRITSLEQQLQLKQSELDELNRKYAAAIAQAGTAGALPPALTNELQQFAQQNPDLVEFDQGKGIVKFKSDLTFDTGDATVKPAAKEAISKFAGILNSPAAANYELMVAGHTDSAPVNNPATVAKGHKNNWYLSSHRAISVGEELVKANVGAQRLGVVGYADQRPVASNGSDAGKTKNRRVEVLILPTQVRSTAPAADTSEAGPSAPRTNGNKDGGATTPPPTPAPTPAPAPDNK